MSEQEPARLTLENLIEFANQAGFFQLLGLQVVSIESGIGKATISVNERLMHSGQIVHGGVIFTLADTAMSMAVLSMYTLGTQVSTIEAKINYLRPVLAGELLAEATLVHKGRSTAVVEANVYNIHEGERLVIARILGTFSIKPPQHRVLV